MHESIAFISGRPLLSFEDEDAHEEIAASSVDLSDEASELVSLLVVDVVAALA